MQARDETPVMNFVRRVLVLSGKPLGVLGFHVWRQRIVVIMQPTRGSTSRPSYC